MLLSYENAAPKSRMPVRGPPYQRPNMLNQVFMNVKQPEKASLAPAKISAALPRLALLSFFREKPCICSRSPVHISQRLHHVICKKRTEDPPLCVCRTLDEVEEKFHPGDILVVPYTTNALLPYIRQAAAVISEEASTESHSATVGLTLDKPVIVAAPNATRRLTDGTVVSVDCARGVVQTLPQ